MSLVTIKAVGYESLVVAPHWMAKNVESRMKALHHGACGCVFRGKQLLLDEDIVVDGDEWRPSSPARSTENQILSPSGKNNSVSVINVLEDLLHKLIDSNIDITWAGAQYQMGQQTAELVLNPKESVDPLQEVAAYVDAAFSKRIESTIDLQALLSSASEGAAQSALDSISSELQTVKSSAATSLMPSKPRRVGVTDNVHPFSAKEDCLSVMCPMSIEIKSTPPTSSKTPVENDCAVLTQAIERAYVARCTDAAISCYIGIAVTGRTAWVVHYQRNLDSFGVRRPSLPYEQLKVNRIAYDSVWKLWSGYMGKTTAHPGWFLTSDGAHLRSTLSCFADPALCLTKLISASGHRVYGVSLPTEVDMPTPGGKRMKVVCASLQKPDFAVKVIPGDKEFDWERTVAEAVCSTYNSMYCDGAPHHVIGTHCLRSACSASLADITSHVPGEDDALTLGSIDLRADDTFGNDSVPAAPEYGEDEVLLRAAVRPRSACLPSLAAAKAFLGGLSAHRKSAQLEMRFSVPVSPCRWRGASKPTADATGGTVVMRVGRRVGKLSLADIKQWQRGVFMTLRAIHAAGYFHCDIRPENVLLFGEEYQLIDHDRAVSQDRPTVLLQPGGQYDLRSASLLDCEVGNSVQWKEALDYEMVAMATLSVLA